MTIHFNILKIRRFWKKNYKHPLFFCLLLLAHLNVQSQNLDVNQTLDYLNKRFNEFPYENENGIFRYNFSITPSGELKIEHRHYIKNIFEPRNLDLGDPAITFYKIAFDKIDIIESFQSSHYDDKNITVYPTWNGSYYEEKIAFLTVPGYKKTVPAMNSNGRNYILILLGDVSKLESINNAFYHLCTLIISDPIKYGLNRESDPFANPVQAKKSDIISENLSNSIKIIKTESGLIEVPIVLNDVLRINFIFDSGASEVSLSPDVALTLMRTGTIAEDDWLPSQTYSFADGSTAKSKRFLIKKLIIGNQVLTNIEASISNSIEAPMLVGQNVMSKLGSITIDYENQLLIIKTK